MADDRKIPPEDDDATVVGDDDHTLLTGTGLKPDGDDTASQVAAKPPPTPPGSPTPPPDDDATSLGTVVPPIAPPSIGARSTPAPPTTAAGATPPSTAPDTRAPAADDQEDDVTVFSAQPVGQPRLLLRDSSGDVREHPLTKREETIGRSLTCDLVVPNPEVSRQHATLAQRGSQYAILATGARGNTYVNGGLTTSERLLHHGDVIELASERLVFAIEADRPPFEPTPPAGPAPAMPSTGRGFSAGVLGLGLAAVVLAVVAVQALRAPTPPADVVPATAVEQEAPVRQPKAAPAAGAARAAEPETVAVAPAAEERAESVRKLLYEGDIAMVERRYTTPPDGSAVYAYGKVLELDPANEAARTRLSEIVINYLDWSERALRRNDVERARVYRDKAVYVHRTAPSAGDLAAITQRLATLDEAIASRAH